MKNTVFTNSHEIWHRCSPWGVQDTYFLGGRKCVAMVTAYYGKNRGKISTLPQFFTNSHAKFALGCRCARHAMVMAYYGK